MTLPTGTREIELIAEKDKWQKRAQLVENILWRVFCLLLATLPKDRIDDAINRLMARAQVMK